MCGICGVINFDRRQQVERRVLDNMNQQMVHRGPDDSGIYLSENIGLAMRRLSIIDLPTGHQPLSNEDETLWLVFNGEIYNYQELRERLESRGHHFRSRSDTETIIHLYEEYGAECVKHLRGMFSFALWDTSKRSFFAARDRLGIKPFYYLHTSERLLFGSEIKSLLSHPRMKAEVNLTCLPEYLAFGYLAGTETFFAGVNKLAPGCTLEVNENGQLRIRQYWDLELTNENIRSRDYYVETYRGLLEDSVRSHLMSDVPIGVFLSGGIDSSSIAALTTKIQRSPVETFSVGYEETAYSELLYARKVAVHLGSVHHEIRVGCQEFFDALPSVVWHEDEPAVWPSSVALYHVAKLAREHVKVILTGEGSDETLAGYTRYPMTLWNARLQRIYKFMPPALRKALRAWAFDARWINARVQRMLKHTFLLRDGDSWSSIYFDNFFSVFSEAEQADILNDDLRGSPGSPYQNSMRYLEDSSGDLIHRLLYTDIKTYLVELLMKQDSMSMAASIESRVPFLDHVLVEFANSIPGSLQTRGLSGKQILKSAVEDLLPHSILYRRKMGFPTPLQTWLAGPQFDVVERLLLEPRCLTRGLFKLAGLQTLFAEHRARATDHTDRIWRLLNLEIWHRVFIDRDRPAQGTATINVAAPRQYLQPNV
jgi:asparagine synthase (glutamine-hydrolysing)